MADLQSTLSFIASEANDDDLERVINGIKERRRALGAIRSASVRVGAMVTTAGLSPKYLNDLSGTVAMVKGTRCDILLTERSTNTLRIRGTKHYISTSVANYLLSGVPLPCAHLVEGPRQPTPKNDAVDIDRIDAPSDEDASHGVVSHAQAPAGTEGATSSRT